MNTEDRNTVLHTDCDLVHRGDCVSLSPAPSGGQHAHGGFSSEQSKAQGRQGVDEVQKLIIPELLLFPRMGNLQGLKSFYMLWGQRPAREPTL